jgi:hypothetical protein
VLSRARVIQGGGRDWLQRLPVIVVGDDALVSDLQTYVYHGLLIGHLHLTALLGSDPFVYACSPLSGVVCELG